MRLEESRHGHTGDVKSSPNLTEREASAAKFTDSLDEILAAVAPRPGPATTPGRSSPTHGVRTRDPWTGSRGRERHGAGRQAIPGRVPLRLAKVNATGLRSQSRCGAAGRASLRVSSASLRQRFSAAPIQFRRSAHTVSRFLLLLWKRHWPCTGYTVESARLPRSRCSEGGPCRSHYTGSR